MSRSFWHHLVEKLGKRRSQPRRTCFRPRCEELEGRIVLAAPENDLFADASLLSGFSATTSGSVLEATLEAGEPNHSGVWLTNSVWWKWTAPESGNATIDTYAGPLYQIDTVLAVYKANDPAQPAIDDLTVIASDDDGGLDSLVQFPAQAETTYYIAVTGRIYPLFPEIEPAGPFTLHVNLRPFNDNFAAAAVISGPSVTTVGYSNNATGQADEPNHAGASGTLHSVWWSWTAPQSGITVLDTLGSGFNTTLGVYIGAAVSALIPVASNDNVRAEDVVIDPLVFDLSPVTQSLVVFSAAAGTTYHFAVDGTAASAGPITINLTMVLNDDIADAEELTGPSDQAVGTTIGASREAGEPVQVGTDFLNNGSVWYRWTAAEEGVAIVDTSAGSVFFNSVLAVYTATDPAHPAANHLTLVAGNDNLGAASGSSASQVIFQASAGTTYYIAVDGRFETEFDRTRNVTLRLHVVDAPPNDALAGALPFFLDARSLTGTNTGATGEPGEPNHASVSADSQGMLHSIWWSMPSQLFPAHVLALDTFGSNFDTTLAVFSAPAGSQPVSFNDLTLVSFNNDAGGTRQSQVVFPTSAALDYFIAVDGAGGSQGQALLSWRLPTFNDDFADAWPILSGVPQYVSFDPVGAPPRPFVEVATHEVGEPNHAGAAADAHGNFASLWWAFTAPVNGTLAVDTSGSAFDTVLAVYSANDPAHPAVNSLAEVASNDDAGGGAQSRVLFDAAAGTTYYIALAGKNGTGGFAAMNLAFTADPTPVNHPPAASNLNQSATYARADAVVPLIPMVISDPDAGEILTATLTLNVPAAGTLTADSGHGETYDAATGIWTATGALADVNAALAGVAFVPAADFFGDVRLDVSIRDAAGAGPDGLVTLGADGNGDDIADTQQDNVVTLQTTLGTYVTLVAPPGTSLDDVVAVDNPSPVDAPAGVTFPLGFFSFTLTGLAPGGAAAVTILPLDGATVNTYYLFGPTPNNPEDHWHEFLYDGTTGAEFVGGAIVLHLVDGARGDNDLTANGTIVDPGAPGWEVVQLYSLSGFVFVDLNNDGAIDFGEGAIAGVQITLTGTDHLGNPVALAETTDADGAYSFHDLRPGSYLLTEQQPDGYLQGANRVGTLGGELAALDQFYIELAWTSDPGAVTTGLNYNFGERPAATGAVQPGQTAGIGFWNNRHGQALIQSLNGAASATQLGNWLAATLPNLYGADAGASNLAGKTNAQVAAFFQGLFREKGKKLEAQVLATALAVYVTNETLAGTTATAYGFQVTTNGTATQTFNVACSGAAFGVANGSSVTVLDLLLAVNARTKNGLLYDLNGNGNLGGLELLFRALANKIFSAINEAGGI